MNDLFENFSSEEKKNTKHENAPLASRFRPRTLEEYVGQAHLLGSGKLLRRAIEADRLSSLILFGPPGSGKTSLAQIIANTTQCHFEKLSGVESGTADMRRVLASALNRLHTTGKKTILFIDEIHRFNKAQQDVLLPDVENATVRLIGATTHNPFFYINAPLVSRSQVFQLEPLNTKDIKTLLQRALNDSERGLGKMPLVVDTEALNHLAIQADGDARKALNSLEIAALTTKPDQNQKIHITLPIAEECIQKKAIVYDANEDQHYDTISAFIKSIRGSDPDAAIYWLAKMLYAGEEIRFIARRLVISAAEDIGMADPHALPLAVAAQQAVEFIGLPEARIPLAEATVYLATAPKSNASYMALENATDDVKKGVTLAVPRHLRDAHYPGSKKLGHQGYQYSHNFIEGIAPQDYLNEVRTYYIPTEHGYEKKIQERLEYWKSLKKQSSNKID
ncbi:MAG: replication-associated recombination protein A [Verrucomicrobiae bacterium]|nr:replication-associated recombination protein A [Verrucomicrobiae bacterium]